MKILKYALLGVALLALLAGGVLAYLVLTFEPRDHEPRIVALVKEKTGRTLHLEGDIKLAFWPDLGVDLGRVWLTERDSEERFADVENARLTAKLVPLVSGELIADEVVIRGAHVRITRFEDGRLNIDDLLKGEGGEVKFDIGRVAVEGSALSYRDSGSGRAYELTEIAFRSGRLANAVPTPVTLALNAEDTPQTFQLSGTLTARLLFDLQLGTYALDESVLGLKGRVPGMSDLAAQATGNFLARLKEGDLGASGLAVEIKGSARGEAIEGKLEAAKIVVAAGQARGEEVSANVRATGAAGTTAVKLELPRLERDADVFKSEAVALDLDMKRGSHTIRAAIATAMSGGIAGRTVTFSGLKSNFVASGPRLPRKGVSGALTGEASIDAAKEGIQVRLAGKVADSQVKAQVASAGFASPVYTFAVEVDELDFDRYTAPDTGKRDAPAGGLDLSPLATLPASGTLAIGVLKAADVQARDVKLVLKP